MNVCHKLYFSGSPRFIEFLRLFKQLFKCPMPDGSQRKPTGASGRKGLHMLMAISRELGMPSSNPVMDSVITLGVQHIDEGGNENGNRLSHSRGGISERIVRRIHTAQGREGVAMGVCKKTDVDPKDVLLVWASPPCDTYSKLGPVNKERDTHTRNFTDPTWPPRKDG